MGRHRLNRWSRNGAGAALRVLLLAAFLFTGPGLSGVEVLAHVAGHGQAEHERQPHFEEAGAFSHADHCGLGLAAYDGRLPTCGAIRLDDGTAARAIVGSRPSLSLPSAPRTHGFPRAPPGTR